MKKPCRKYAPEANPRPLFTFGKYLKTAIACKEFFYKSDILNKDYQKALKKLTILFFRTACRLYSYVIRMSLVYTRISSVCHSYVLVCHPYVTCMYLHVIRMSLVCTRMSPVCHSSVVLPWTVEILCAFVMCLFSNRRYHAINIWV